MRRFLVDPPACAVEECPKPSHAKSYCRAHYLRLTRHGDPLGLSEWAQGNRSVSQRWEARKLKPGDRSKAGEGYMYVYAPDSPMANSRGNVLEHRMVLAEHLGRPLLPTESVHHTNGDKSDNRVENLELWAGEIAQPSGQRPRDLVAWARRVIDQYGREVDSGLL